MYSTSRIEKPLSRLRKSISRVQEGPDPEAIHSMRTATRRIEAVLMALLLDRKKRGQKMLRMISPLRKAAGGVRDLDVLISDAMTLDQDDSNREVLKLVETLVERRNKEAGKLGKIVDRNGSKVRRRLKRSEAWILETNSGDCPTEHVSQLLLKELVDWPPFHENNLHNFRIAAKGLHYILDLGGKNTRRLVRDLERVKDVIGEWHDWDEMFRFAGKHLGDAETEGLMSQIDAIRRRRLHEALQEANAFRQRVSLNDLLHAAGGRSSGPTAESAS